MRYLSMDGKECVDIEELPPEERNAFQTHTTQRYRKWQGGWEPFGQKQRWSSRQTAIEFALRRGFVNRES